MNLQLDVMRRLKKEKEKMMSVEQQVNSYKQGIPQASMLIFSYSKRPDPRVLAGLVLAVNL